MHIRPAGRHTCGGQDQQTNNQAFPDVQYHPGNVTRFGCSLTSFTCMQRPYRSAKKKKKTGEEQVTRLISAPDSALT